MPCVVGKNPNSRFGVQEAKRRERQEVDDLAKVGPFGVTGCPILGKSAEPQNPCASLSFQLDSLILGMESCCLN